MIFVVICMLIIYLYTKINSKCFLNYSLENFTTLTLISLHKHNYKSNQIKFHLFKKKNSCHIR